MADSNQRWSIAIHGGAGGGPANWDSAKKAARQEGLQRALDTGVALLQHGASAIDVVEAVIIVFENDANFNAGRGAVLTEDGTAELDASIMDGATLGCGAVAGVRTVKNPIGLARLVMTETPHVLLAGPGADEFATDQGVDAVTPDYFLSYSSPNDDVAPDTPPHFGTVGCVVLDTMGDLAAGTSTGGTSKKLPGRVGDSPIIGAGTFAANDTCAVSGTGLGEEYIRAAVAYDVVAQMRYAGRSLDEAVTEIMTRRLKPGTGGLIAVSRDGQVVMQHNTPGMNCGMADSSGRRQTSFALPDGGRTPRSTGD
ncbi:Isoaspartyl peptidase precursor [Rubripirellula lacrimiformis]|uniref:Isoaspartyl peptidase n=1 Tax=Rubripirellula lacrimiformis TaxID=1930273 RepID=A0A517NJ27_9BACT|nr:isoaspartyl peptidase/L-asparaginase [Rubripirellula lacrimiformis]QDT07134.1 Isoaspartyl peptidase precursor [Rubripirellula lacrimiformis]